EVIGAILERVQPILILYACRHCLGTFNALLACCEVEYVILASRLWSSGAACASAGVARTRRLRREYAQRHHRGFSGHTPERPSARAASALVFVARNTP